MPIGKNTLQRIASTSDAPKAKKSTGIVTAAPEVPAGDPATPVAASKKKATSTATKKTATKAAPKTAAPKTAPKTATPVAQKPLEKKAPAAKKPAAPKVKEKDRFAVVHVGEKMPVHLL